MNNPKTLLEREAPVTTDGDILRKSQIPATIRIGVTGHRELTEAQSVLVVDSVRKVLGTLDTWLSDNLRHSSHAFVVVSPLAEGADRIVAGEVLNWEKADPYYKPKLEAVMPFPEDEYLKDFPDTASRAEFKDLLSRARSVKVLQKSRPSKGAYVSAGRYVVHSCDVLIAIWNGLPSNGKGGTGDIVEYARGLGQSIFIIDPGTGEIKEEWNKKWVFESLKDLDVFNQERLDDRKLADYIESRYRSLEKKTAKAGLPPAVVEPIREDLLPKYARASLLAKRYQAYYQWAGGMIYVLSALAIIAVAIQTLFIHDGPPYLVWAEFFMILTVLILLWALEHYVLHRRWIDYRFLAERMRIAIFLSIAGIEFKPLKYPPYFSISEQSDYWIVKAFGWALNNWSKTTVKSPFEASKKFLLDAWVDDQLSFYRKKFEANENKTKKLDIAGYLLFLMTLVAAFMHATGLEERLPEVIASPNYLTFIGIVFPMVGALLVGFQVHREYKRNAERYRQMIGPLYSISQQMRLAESDEALASLLEKANDLMLKENQDWRVSILSQKIGV